MDRASYGRSVLVAGSPLPSASISFGVTLVMAIACGVAAANISGSCKPLPGPGYSDRARANGNPARFAAGLLLLVPSGSSRRSGSSFASIVANYPVAPIPREIDSRLRFAIDQRQPRSITAMYVVLNAVVPRLIMPITMVLTIVIPFLVTLGIAPIVDYLTVVHYAA